MKKLILALSLLLAFPAASGLVVGQPPKVTVTNELITKLNVEYRYVGVRGRIEVKNLVIDPGKTQELYAMCTPGPRASCLKFMIVSIHGAENASPVSYSSVIKEDVVITCNGASPLIGRGCHKSVIQ